MSNLSFLAFYAIALTLFFSTTSLSSLQFLITAEIFSLSFILVMLKNFFIAQKDSFPQTLFYFMIQTMASMAMLCLFIAQESSKFMELANIFIIISLLLKMGIWPFDKWTFQISLFLEGIQFSMLMSLSKIPFMMMLSYENLDLCFWILFFNLIYGSILISQTKNLYFFLICSSLHSMFLMFFLLKYNILIFLSMILIYFITLVSVTRGGWKKNYWKMMSVIFIMGLPPFSLFFYKFAMANFFFLSLNYFMFFAFWVMVLVAFMSYYKFFFIEYLTISSWNKDQMKKKQKKFLFTMVTMMMFI